MTVLRIIGDVHAQFHPDDVAVRDGRGYLELIADAPYSVQVGDMGDGETYDQLIAHVDAGRHRFFPGNHECYDRLPPHSLGDFGAVSWGGVDFFFVRGAQSADKDVLVRMGREQGKTLWFPQEELTDEQMAAAEREYLLAKPTIMLSHDAPTEIAWLFTEYARRFRAVNPEGSLPPSRTKVFLARLWEQHQPRLWAFGHHHRNWKHREGPTQFVCVGQLSHIDVDAAGELRT
jgi:hypothetical protein